MLSKPYRLKKRKSFNYIYRRGKHVGNDTVAVVFVSCKMKDAPVKIGYSVSKKVGNSVTRNRVTRLMRVATKALLAQIKPNHSMIFVAKEGIDKKHVSEIQTAIANVLKRGGIL